jgi:hypothetical protein
VEQRCLSGGGSGVTRCALAPSDRRISCTIQEARRHQGDAAQTIRMSRLRQTRERGLVNIHLQHILTAAARNAVRVTEWIGRKPTRTPHRSAFATLALPISLFANTLMYSRASCDVLRQRVLHDA